MSNHIISLAYKRNLRTPMRKAVMVLLADKASDDGSGIWASKQTMADELCCSKQSVISTIQDFLAEGLLVELGHRKSPNGFTVEYGIALDALAALPMVNCHSNDQSETLTGQPPLPVKDVDGTGQPPLPKPSRTLLPSGAKAPSGKRKRAKIIFELPDWVPADAWDAFNEMRKAMPKVPFTDEAKKGIVEDLEKLKAQGHDPAACLRSSVKHGYRGVFPPKGAANENRPSAKPMSDIDRRRGELFRKLQAGDISDTEFERERARLDQQERRSA